MDKRAVIIVKKGFASTVLALLLVVTLLPFVARTPLAMGLPIRTGAPEQAAAPPATGGATVVKDEVVYTLLGADGAVGDSYVINHFKVREAGLLADFGGYGRVMNLTSVADMAVADGQVTVPVEAGDFYYEGVLGGAQLPWLIDIRYALDGVQVAPERLAGSSGRLQIDITTRQNSLVDPVFFENYLLQVQLTLPTESVSDMVAEGATVASVGGDEQVAFMVLPGREGALRLTAQVSDFEMAGIRVSGVPFAMVFDVPDTVGMVDDLSELGDAIGLLNEGVGELADGIGLLEEGAPALAAGSGQVQTGLGLLSDNAALLVDASGKINVALGAIAQQAGSGGVDSAQLTQLVAGLRQLAAGLYSGNVAKPGLYEALGEIKSGVDQSMGALEGLIAGLSVVDGADIMALGADPGFGDLLPDSQQTIGGLIGVNTQAAKLAGYWYAPGGIKEGLGLALAGLQSSADSCLLLSQQLSAAADGLEDSFGSLDDVALLLGYLQQLAQQYADFDAGLADFSAGTQALATQYTSFDAGLGSYLGGTAELYGGATALHDGTVELYVNTADLPATVQEQIDTFLKDYQTSDFELRSFVDERNANVNRVQFVMLSDAIEKPAESGDGGAGGADGAGGDASAPVEKTFLDRLKALF